VTVPLTATGLGDAELVAAVAAGDKEALAALYRRHAGWLAGRLVARASDAGMAEEALQDTFVAVWRHAGHYDGSGDAGAWLWGIAWRCLASLARRRRLPLARFDQAVEEQAGWPGPEEEALAGEFRERLLAAVERLPEAQRKVLRAVVFQGHTMAQHAGAEGVAVGTIKSRLSRARTALKEVLEL
jgi:RNA polymerase sigma-70 factor (ECF subfamily)